MKWLIAILAIVSVAGCCNPQGSPYGYGYPQQPSYGANPYATNPYATNPYAGSTNPYATHPYGGAAPYTPPAPTGGYTPPASTAPALPTAPAFPAPQYQQPSFQTPSIQTPAIPSVTVPAPATGTLGIPGGSFPPPMTNGVPSIFRAPAVGAPPAAGASLQPVPSLASPPTDAGNRTTTRTNNNFVPPASTGDLPSLGSIPAVRARNDWPPRNQLQRNDGLAWGGSGGYSTGSYIYPNNYVAPISYSNTYSAPVQPLSVRNSSVISDEACCGPTTSVPSNVPIASSGYDYNPAGVGYDVSGYSSPSYTAQGWQPRSKYR